MKPGTRDRLDRALATWRDWGLPLEAPPELFSEAPGGRTNMNLRLRVSGLGSDLLLRLNHPEPASLGIDRGLEREILIATAEAGLGRPVWYWDPQERFAVFPWIEARPWDSADLASPGQRKRVWPLVERLAEIRIDRPRRRYVNYLQHYWRQLEQADRVDPDLQDRWQRFRTELDAFDHAPWPARLVHHDLIPANILDTSDRLYLIDWEYAAVGHPDIDRWAIDPDSVREPFIAELMTWINDLWERLRVAA